MKSLVLCSKNTGENETYGDVALKVASFPLEKNKVYCSMMEIDPPDFDSQLQAHHVFIRVLAFSCNYRDKSIILAWSTLAAQQIAKDSEAEYYSGIGSEFVAEVMEVGEAVKTLVPGDRVILDASFPLRRDGEAPGGLSTNHASLRYHVIHEFQLMRIPKDFPIEVAAGFTIAGQTVFGMLDRLQLKPDANILVTSAKSLTSLFAISALKKYKVYALSSSAKFKEQVLELGAKDLWVMEHGNSNFLQAEDLPRFQQVLQDTGGFDAVIDPFIDLHLDRLLDFVKLDGQYISCGFYQQYSGWEKKTFRFPSERTPHLFGNLIAKKINIYGHCLGKAIHLEKALAAFQKGEVTLPIDTVYGEEDLVSFFEKTYNSKDRFGKVIFKYQD